MSAVSDLIERMEKETGQRIDANNGDNSAMAGLFGALARAMGKSPVAYKEKDDVAAGLLIRYQASSEYRLKQERRLMVAEMLANGISPTDIGLLMGN